MDSNITEKVISGMNDLLKEKNFIPIDNQPGFYKNEKKTISIYYDESKKFFVLLCGDNTNDDSTPDMRAVSNWLFDPETNNENDLSLISEDFSQTLLKELGMVRRTRLGASDVMLPSKNLTGDAADIDNFTAKFLVLFPQYKPTYKEHIAQYGEFLYLNFFKQTAVKHLEELAKDKIANKKHLIKFFDLLGDMYYIGDRTVSDTIVGTIIAGAFIKQPELFQEMSGFMDEYPELRKAGIQILNISKRDKNFIKIFE